jgi:hypothetical protein
MTDCFCSVCPFGAPNALWAVVHCRNRLPAAAASTPAPRRADNDVPEEEMPAWQANASLPLLFTRAAA